MIIYLDLIFLFNFILNLIFLIIIEIIYKAKLKMLKIILGAAVGGGIVILSLFDYYLANILKIGGGVLIGIIGLENLSRKYNMIKYSSFYILNLASVGLINAFGINTHLLLYLSLAAIIIIYFFESNKNLVIFTNSLKYNIIVNFKKTSLKLRAYLDTGNFSEANNLPIIYISNKYYETLSSDANYLVEINTVNSKTFQIAYKPKTCFIEKNKKLIMVSVLVVFCDLENFDCLLNMKILL